MKTLNVGGRRRRIVFSPDGKRVIITNEAGWINLIAR